jgi:hypothetical protein
VREGSRKVLRLAEERHVDRVGDRQIGRVVGVDAVAAVVHGIELRRLRGVADDAIEVDETVEDAARANPGNDLQTLRFVLRRKKPGTTLVVSPEA